MLEDDVQTYSQCVEVLHQQLGDAAFNAVWSEGRTLLLNEAIAYALNIAAKLG